MIHLTILNLKEKIFEGNVASLTLPADLGELTILPNHVPLITPLKKGIISAIIEKNAEQSVQERKYFESSGGILEFNNNKATILL